MTKPTRTGALDWEDIRIFAALARHRTLARAAAALELRGADITRHVSHLERALDRKLFMKHGSGFRLTADGLSALGEAAQMEMAACALLEGRDCVPPARTRMTRGAR